MKCLLPLTKARGAGNTMSSDKQPEISLAKQLCPGVLEELAQ